MGQQHVFCNARERKNDTMKFVVFCSMNSIFIMPFMDREQPNHPHFYKQSRKSTAKNIDMDRIPCIAMNELYILANK